GGGVVARQVSSVNPCELAEAAPGQASSHLSRFNTLLYHYDTGEEKQFETELIARRVSSTELPSASTTARTLAWYLDLACGAGFPCYFLHDRLTCSKAEKKKGGLAGLWAAQTGGYSIWILVGAWTNWATGAHKGFSGLLCETSHEQVVHGTFLALASVCLRRRSHDVRVTFKLGLLVFLIVAQQSTPVPAGGIKWTSKTQGQAHDHLLKV
ncbi:hypothetical protein PpBr36_00424, partial [Pyricularia pennisetigena]|uniref:hypothetical protein n=1 Tax=Pyricularia pennisetigena TaxID=1578925 RepID=UPI00114E8DAE